MENKVAKKAIETIDLLKLINVNDIKGFDIKPFLFKDLILKEKEFRSSLKSFNFQDFENKLVYVYCSSDAIIPRWAYMLVSSYLTDLKIKHNFALSFEAAVNKFVEDEIIKLNVNEFSDKRVIIKGCSGKISINEQAYMKITEILKPVAKAISYGEACSMVPVSKK